MAVQIGPKIGIEGESEYRNQIKKIINETKALDSAMEKTASEWNKNTSQMTKNKAIAQNLAQQIDLQQQKLSAMNAMLEQSTAKFGANASATLSWQRAVDSATASLNHMQAELQTLHGAEGISELQTKFADFGTKMQNIGQSLTSVGQKLTTSVTLPLVAVGAAYLKLGSDLQESANKADVVFGSMSASVREFAQNSLEAYAISEGKALEMASDYGAMATSMGLSQREAAKLSTELVGLAGDMASFHNKSVEVAQNSLRGVFTGETESLKQFGVAMTESNLEDFAQKHGKVYDQMSQGEKIMTRYAFVLKSQSDALGDASRTMDGFAGSTRQFKGALEEAGAALGEALIPLITPVVQALTRLLQIFANLPKPVIAFIAVIGALAAAIGPVIMVVGMMMSAFGSIVTNAPLVVTAFMHIAEAAAAMGAAIGAALPEVLLVVAVLAAVGIAAYEVVTHWDQISEAAGQLGAKVSAAFQALMQKNEELRNNVHSFISDIVSFFGSLPGKIVDALKSAAQKVADIFDQMISKAKKSGKDFIDGFVDGIRQRVQKIIDAVKDIANTVKDFLGFSRPDKGPLHEYEEWMPHFMQGLTKGIRSNMGLVKSAMNDVAKTMALPLDANAPMNVALAGAGTSGSSALVGGNTMNVYVDHINELNDLIRIQNQAQQRMRMGAR